MESEVPNLFSGYSFTNKLNGSRYRILLAGFKYNKVVVGMVFLFANTEIKFVMMVNPSDSAANSILGRVNNSLIDIELFNNQGIFELHSFDCPVFAGNNNTIASHDVRLSVLRQDNLVAGLNSILAPCKYVFEVKNFFYSGNPSVDLTDAVRYMYGRYGDRTELDNDGLIATPVGMYDKSVRGNMVAWTKSYYDHTYPIYKWKFPDTVSIDFVIDELDAIVKSGKQYRVFSLLVFERGKLVPFVPFSRGKYYNVPSVFMIDAAEADELRLQSGQVLELGFDRSHNSFRFLRSRPDKTEPNSKYTAEATFVDMDTEFSLSKLKTLLEPKKSAAAEPGKVHSLPAIPDTRINPGPAKKCLVTYREYHNRIKTGLIKKWCLKKRVCDLGAGKGGDLAKYLNSKIEHLWAVEPNREYVEGPEGFKERLAKYDQSFQKRVEVIVTGAEDSSGITKAMMKSQEDEKTLSSQAEVMATFFSMSFFFKDQATLDALVKTIVGNMTVGGVAIGTMMDGQRAFEQLKAGGGTMTDPGAEKCYYIKQKFPEDVVSVGVGNAIGINLSGTPTVQNEQQEWLAPFEVLQGELEKRNVFLVESLFFDDPLIAEKFTRPRKTDTSTEDLYAKLGSGEKALNRLYRYFVFERRQPEPSAENKQRLARLQQEREQNSLESMDIDEADQQQIVKADLYPEPLYRVGVLGKGSCFYQSLMFLLITEAYTQMENSDRTKLVKKMRGALAKALSPQMFSKLSNGEIERSSYLTYVRKELEDAMITQVIADGETPTISNSKLNEIIDASSHYNTIEEQIAYFLTTFEALGYDKDDIGEIINQARLGLWTDYKARLENCAVWTSHDTMEYIVRSIKRNIFVIADSTRLPVKFMDCSLYNPDLPSIIILNLEGLTGKSSPHFEPVVQMTEGAEERSDKIDTVTNFKWDHPLVQSMYKYLCEQD
jgi:hypothetical protein